jgi:hypothetical protein
MQLWKEGANLLAMLGEATMAAVVGAYVVIIGVIWKVTDHMSDKAIHGNRDEVASAEGCRMFTAHIEQRVTAVEKHTDEVKADVQADLNQLEVRISRTIEGMKSDVVGELRGIRGLLEKRKPDIRGGYQPDGSTDEIPTPPEGGTGESAV